jgi:hypothetical protein
MSANAIGRYLPYAAGVRPHAHERALDRERRTSVRTAVRWPILFRHRQSETVESVTENLSSQGFYCYSHTPVAFGEPLVCWLTVPTHDPSGNMGKLVLECRVRVVRSDAASADGKYGLACRIEDYHFGAESVLS